MPPRKSKTKTQKVDKPLLLPPVLGPQLGPFDTGGRELDIQFLERLGPGGDSIVFRASINGREYAIKLFKFGVKRQGLDGVKLSISKKWSQETQMYYMHPFYNECRVYGRLKETQNEHLSVKCFGHLLLGNEYKQELLSRWDVTDEDWEYDDDDHSWDHCSNRTPPWYSSSRSQKNDPIMAIVKDLLEFESFDDQPEVKPSDVPRIIRSVNSLHRLGIWIGDVEQRNFFKGVLFDFSRAVTAPHDLLNADDIEEHQTNPEWWVTCRDYKDGFTYKGFVSGPVSDCFAVDRMIAEVEEETTTRIWVRMRSNIKYKKKLRRPPTQHPQPHEYWPKYRPELYEEK